ncbi:hypothetical protein L226DRAFT_608608 [Lentinus tigrinus ALCF2SS1-7]|uniref:uncharacterized protein n=1 Tax=Lentinus tigrinus ALCF2SS1-7 TaxID=1328758 RepID=UPI001165FAF3|nr:hypothetical protein L226DRAFT_608608 [Lentinus tigrinus ALCF2SS1-7]
MGGWEESWALINMDRWEYSNLFNALHLHFFNLKPSLEEWLTLPAMTSKMDKWLASRTPVAQTGPFGKLSVELLDLIWSHLVAALSASPPRETPKLAYMLAFGITCTRILAVGERHILRALRAHHAPWAACRLICVNRATTWADLPAGLFTDAETHELGLDRNTSEYGSLYRSVYRNYVDGHGPDGSQWHENKTVHALRKVLFAAEYPFCNPFGPHWDTRPKVQVQGAGWDDARRLIALHEGGWPTEAEGAVRVLCNLSKGQYVRSDRIPRENERRPFRLDSALLSRICCTSSDADFYMQAEGEHRAALVHGPWAGDRFCIVPLDMLSEVFGGEEDLRDVSEETRVLLQHLWTLNRPEEWLDSSAVLRKSSRAKPLCSQMFEIFGK